MSHEVRQAEDSLPERKIAVATAVSFAVAAIALVVAGVLLEYWGKQPVAETKPAPPTISTVEQTLVLHTERGIDLRREQTAALQRLEWVDRDAGIARIPIDTAIDIFAASPLPPDRAIEPEAPR
jgi:hypothetical protein